MKILIVYFSLTGNTKKLAVKIYEYLKSKNIDVSLFELEKEKKSFLKNCLDALIRKTYSLEKIPPVENYDCIFIGTPVWAGNITPIVRSFIKEVDLKDKKIFLFTTYGSGLGRKKAMNEFINLIEEKGGKVFGKIEIKGKRVEEKLDFVKEEIENCLKKL